MTKEPEKREVEMEEELLEEEQPEAKKEDKLAGIYSNIASNRYENLRTSHIENKAKKLRKSR